MGVFSVIPKMIPKMSRFGIGFSVIPKMIPKMSRFGIGYGIIDLKFQICFRFSRKSELFLESMKFMPPSQITIAGCLTPPVNKRLLQNKETALIIQ